MTFTKDIETTFASMNLIMRPEAKSTNFVSLESWVSDTQFAPVWIPLQIVNGITKIMPVLPDCRLYPQLMQSIYQRILSQEIILDWQNQPYQLTGVEVDANALHIMLISIFPTAPLPATLGRAIHAQCFQWFANADPILAENLHQENSLPITIAMQYISPQKMLLRITLLKRELLAPLLWGLSRNLGNEIILAGISCQVGKCINILESTSFEKLAEIPSQNIIELQFLSPTSFKQKQNVQPFPLPELVFGNLLRRWNTFAPAKLQFSHIEWSGLISAFELKTHALKMEAGAEIGSKGWVKYRFLDPEQARISTILSNFAIFAGVGRKTGMGMGQINSKFKIQNEE